ncbi:MAG TPA: ATP-binding protein [Acidimicrobiales bacterium]|nr:ATP-binding protein [Acidimicrobiales bacterium]
MAAAPTTEIGEAGALDSGLDAAVRAFRTAAWAWLTVVTVLSFASIERPVAAAVGVLAAGVVTVVWWLPSSPGRTDEVRQRLVAAELLVGAGLVAADGWVYDDGRAQSFGGVWPLAGVLAVAVRSGRRAGVSAGLVLGAARAVGEVVVVRGEWSATQALAVASTGVLFGLAGWAAGWAAGRIRIAERVAVRSAARAEVAAELHDGVLQTLAVVQRRSDDPDLVRLARSQEAELRRFLAGPDETPGGDVPVEVLLRAAAADAIARFGLRVEVAAVPPLPAVPATHGAALRGVVGECLANVAKHAGTDRAVVFAEADDRCLHVSVTDEGAGFDPAAVHERGIADSVRRRGEGLGGTTAIDARPGAGTTITVEIPLEER